MMNFDLTEEHRAAGAVGPRVGGARGGAPHPRARSRAPVRPRPSCRRWRSSGCSASRCPPQYGGAGTDYISLGLASEELEYVDTSLRVILSVHVGLNSLTLLSWGTEDQKQRYLVPQAQGRKIADLRPDRAVGGQRRARHPDASPCKRGDRYVLTGEKMWISLADVADHFLVFAWTDLEKKKQRDPSGLTRVHRRARLQGLLERHAEGEVGHPGRQHRLLQDGRGRGARGERGRPAGRGLQDRDVRARPGALHGGGRRDRADSRVPRRVGEVRARSARPSASRSAQHQLVKEMIAQMESDYQAARLLWLRAGWLKNAGRRSTRETGPGQVVRHRGLRAGRGRRRAGPRRERLLGRVPGRPLLPQLQGRGHLRGHARDSQADAGRLPARLSRRTGRRAASCPP